MDIAPIIRTDFLRIDKKGSLSEMIGKLKQSNKRFGLVFDGKKYAGIVERKSLLKARLNAQETKIAKYLTKAPLLNEHANIIETAYLMYNSNLDFVPVERQGEIIGVIEAKDLNDEWAKKILELTDALDNYIPIPVRDITKPFLMPVEDIFSIEGRGTVVTGRIERGKIKINEERIGNISPCRIYLTFEFHL